ncbi:tetratricopeptide repeat protein [Streptomyces aureocirculatus]|uniref:tetratricopeptide repeat protein n=1 Tax=Streptomyces aureocirculatus TaxID=67275 RepID=UPI00068A33E1|nr:tetratricopeptide repeat protein [Streptomyces aureocirculatus]
MAIEVAALAASGATSTVVGLAVTEAWTQVRARLTHLFSRRRDQGAATEDVEQLRIAFEQLAASLRSDNEHAVGDSADQLRRRLRHSLRQGSETAQELVDLLSEMSGLAGDPPAGSTGSQGAASSAAHSPISYHVPEALRRQGPPSQVPAPRHHFINRSDELAVLNSQLAHDTDPSHVDVRVLAGPPGVGKSALARHWAHTRRTREYFPDGRLYVDFAALRHHTDPGADVTEAVGHCLRSLGVADAHLPPSLGERTALFRDRTADLRVLLVLDDVSSPAQVRALIPNGPGSSVLATSTFKLGELSLDGARPLPLEPLTEAASLLLLADRCGQERVAGDPEAAQRVVGLCSGLPVALQVAAARLVNDPRLTLDALAAELADDGRRLSALRVGGESPVSAVFDSAYRQLPADMAHGYRLLGWIPGPTFDAATAAAALGRDLESAQVLLDVLDDMSLLEVTEERRYRFHGLVRLHARDRAGAEEQSGTRLAVTGRVLTHYLVLTALADRSVRADRLRVADPRTLTAGQPDPFATRTGPRPLDWLEAERANIMAVLRAADEPSLHTPGWQLAECFTVLFLHHRHLGDWQESLELGARYAAAAVSPAAEARLRSLLSRPLMDIGEHDRALRELTAALSCAEIADDPVLHASVLEFSGRYWDRFDLDRAVAAYRRSRELNTRGGEPRGAAIAAFFLGRAQDARGDHDQALGTLHRARTDLLALPVPDHRMAARATAALGRALDNLGRTSEAVLTLREAARTLKRLEAHAYEAEALLDLVSIAERPGADRSTLRDDLTRVVTIHADMGSPLTESLTERLHSLENPGTSTD